MGEVSRARLQGGDLFWLRGWGGDLGVGATEHDGKERRGQEALSQAGRSWRETRSGVLGTLGTPLHTAEGGD